MGLYSGIDKAEPFKSGVYFETGVYVVRIDACRGGHNRKKIGYFLSEQTILHSTNPNRPVGSQACYYIGLDKDGAMGDIRKFCGLASGEGWKEIGEAEVDYITSDENPLAGVILKLVATNKKTKTGGDWTVHEYTLIEGEEAAKWTAFAASLEKAA